MKLWKYLITIAVTAVVSVSLTVLAILIWPIDFDDGIDLAESDAGLHAIHNFTVAELLEFMKLDDDARLEYLRLRGVEESTLNE